MGNTHIGKNIFSKIEPRLLAHTHFECMRYSMFIKYEVSRRQSAEAEKSLHPQDDFIYVIWDFYLWGKLLDQVYSNNPQLLEELQQNIENVIAAFPQRELLHMSHSLVNHSVSIIQCCININIAISRIFCKRQFSCFLTRTKREN